MRAGLSARAWLFLGGVALVATFAATIAPLATYALTLAAFGLVHVFTELRYVDRRFSPRLPFGLTAAWLGLIGLIVLLRVWRMASDAPWEAAPALELGLVSLLALLALPVLRAAPWPRRLVGAGVVAALAYGAWRAPVTTLVILAVLHNLTPIGFLAERFEGRGRWTWLAGAFVLFLVVPFLIAGGVSDALTDRLGWSMRSDGPLGTGTLDQHLGVFVPAHLHARFGAAWLFAAAAYLQCMHYAVVIGLLPRLEPAEAGAADVYVRWPGRRTWLAILVGVAAVGFAYYVHDFRDARTVYGLFALVHAWVEVPVLLAAMAPLPERA